VRALNYAIFRIVRGVLVRAPKGLVFWFADALAVLGWVVDGRHRRVALTNLERALPEFSPKQRRAAAFGSFRSFARMLFDAIASGNATRDELRARLDVEGWHHLDDAESDGHGVLLMTAHFGNWELAGHVFALENRPLAFMARPIDDPRLEEEARALRERFGNHGVPKRGGIRRLLRVLRDRGRVYLMIDQRVHPNEGKAYRFFGRPAYTSPLPANLSIRTGAPVVPFYGIPSEDGRRIRVVIRPPIRPEGPVRPGEEHLDPVDRLTLRYVEEAERAIRERPDLWLWMHRRWRKNPTAATKASREKTSAAPESQDVCIERARHA
jgi:Kdo2-lipid IVA lauroyltransferase/acyltransferase